MNIKVKENKLFRNSFLFVLKFIYLDFLSPQNAVKVFFTTECSTRRKLIRKEKTFFEICLIHLYKWKQNSTFEATLNLLSFCVNFESLLRKIDTTI